MLTYCNPLIHTTCALREYATVQKFALHNQYLQLLEKWYFVFRPRNFTLHTAQKMRFFIKDFFSKCDQNRSFTGEILNGKFHFLWSESSISQQNSKRLNFLYKFHAVCDNSFLLKRAVFLTIFRHTWYMNRILSLLPIIGSTGNQK